MQCSARRTTVQTKTTACSSPQAAQEETPRIADVHFCLCVSTPCRRAPPPLPLAAMFSRDASPLGSEIDPPTSLQQSQTPKHLLTPVARAPPCALQCMHLLACVRKGTRCTVGQLANTVDSPPARLHLCHLHPACTHPAPQSHRPRPATNKEGHHTGPLPPARSHAASCTATQGHTHTHRHVLLSSMCVVPCHNTDLCTCLGGLSPDVPCLGQPLDSTSCQKHLRGREWWGSSSRIDMSSSLFSTTVPSPRLLAQ